MSSANVIPSALKVKHNESTQTYPCSPPNPPDLERLMKLRPHWRKKSTTIESLVKSINEQKRLPTGSQEALAASVLPLPVQALSQRFRPQFH